MLYRDRSAVCSQIHIKRINIFCGLKLEFLNAVAQSRQTPTSFVMSIRPPVRKYQRGSHWTEFKNISHWELHTKISQEIEQKLLSLYTNAQAYIVGSDICKATIETERTVAFSWQRLLRERERATPLLCKYIVYMKYPTGLKVYFRFWSSIVSVRIVIFKKN